MSLSLATASSSVAASSALLRGGGGGGGRGVRVVGSVGPARVVAVGIPARRHRRSSSRASTVLCALKEGEKKGEQAAAATEKQKEEVDDVEAVTRKWGLEAGLWKAVRSGDSENSKTSAKDLLARYGGAYLATSITLSALSFGLCYALVRAGVDVGSLLERVPGVGAINQQGEQLGAIALAYAAHKAASPIRFPPTVALTPLVARWFANLRGNNDNNNNNKEDNNTQ